MKKTKGKKACRHISYWCPTCKKQLILETEAQVICSKPMCSECKSEVWPKSDKWITEHERMEKVKRIEAQARMAEDARVI